MEFGVPLLAVTERGIKMAGTRLLLKNITCPHCWSTIAPSDILWVSASAELIGDFRLGEVQQRFLPSRFNLQGQALDPKNFVCSQMACPHCHLVIPRSHLEMRPYFISIAGAPATGKSYFLTSMIYQLRRTFPTIFHLNFIDADPLMNRLLHQYENLQFLTVNPESLFHLEKTQEQGDQYNSVLKGEETVTYLQPFLFAVSPLAKHVNKGIAEKISVSLCLYDNAGESFLPSTNSDRASLPVTRHLGKSHCIFFLFDPTQDRRFRDRCQHLSTDPQITKQYSETALSRQDMVLAELIRRTRNYTNLGTTEKYQNPVIIVVTKLDAWQKLLPELDLSLPWKNFKTNIPLSLSLSKIQTVSTLVRNLLLEIAPEMVGMVEGFANDVTYIPVSATGGPPEINATTKIPEFRAKNIKPLWAEVPALYAMARSSYGIISVEG